MENESRSGVSPSPGRKLGETLAYQIEDEIIAANWPVGTVLGSEADLCDKYGVSRAVFREAIRIVGHHGVGEMRRGPGGGLVVVEPRDDAAVRSVFLNLRYSEASPAQINEIRVAVEVASARAAIDNLDEVGEQTIRDFLAIEHNLIMEARPPSEFGEHFASNRFHLLLAELSGNPALALFVQIIGRISTPHTSAATSLDDLRTTADELHQAHARIAESILNRDREATERHIRTHLEAIVGSYR